MIDEVKETLILNANGSNCNGAFYVREQAEEEDKSDAGRAKIKFLNSVHRKDLEK